MRDLVQVINETEIYLSDLIELSEEIDLSGVYSVIHLLLPIYTQLICIYYDLFVDKYKNNTHPCHQDWLSIYDLLCRNELIERMEDYYFFTEKLHNREIQKILAAHYLLSMDGRMKIENSLNYAIFKQSEEYRELYRTLFDYQIVENAQGTLSALQQEYSDEEALIILRNTLKDNFDVNVRVVA